MDIEKEREAFERLPLAELAIKSKYVYYSEKTNSYCPNEDFCPSDAPEAMNFAWEAWQVAKAQAVPEGFVVCKSEPVAYIVQNKFWKQKFDVKSVKDMPPQKWEDDHYDVEIPLYVVSLDGLVLKEQDEDEAND